MGQSVQALFYFYLGISPTKKHFFLKFVKTLFYEITLVVSESSLVKMST